MKTNQHQRSGCELVMAVFICLFLFSSTILSAQGPTNLSGKWEFDKSASDKEETGDASFNGKIILEIRQKSDSILFFNTFFIPGKEGISIPAGSFLANGNVSTDNSGTDPAKKFIKWSPDKKILTTSYIMTASIDGVAQEFITATTYNLSADGKTLLVSELHKSKLNGEKTVKKVYRKK
jgi:hypothetical protein